MHEYYAYNFSGQQTSDGFFHEIKLIYIAVIISTITHVIQSLLLELCSIMLATDYVACVVCYLIKINIDRTCYTS